MALVEGCKHSLEITVPVAEGKTIQRLENRSQVLERRYDDSGTTVTMHVRIGRRQLDMLKSSSHRIKVHEAGPRAPAWQNGVAR